MATPLRDVPYRRVMVLGEVLGGCLIIWHLKHLTSQCSVRIVASIQSCSLELDFPLFDISFICHDSGLRLCQIEIEELISLRCVFVWPRSNIHRSCGRRLVLEVTTRTP